MIKQTIRYYLLLKGMSMFGISFISAVYVTFLLSRGLDLFQVNLVNLVFFTTLFLCEIPTGAFADVFGRKHSFVISCLLFGLGMYVYSVSHSFWAFALAEAVSAVGNTFSSGAFQAWAVDKLKHHGHEGSLASLFAKEQQIGHTVGIIGALAGAFLADRSMSLPWIAGGSVMVLTALLAQYIMKEEYFVRQKFSFKAGLQSMKNTIRASIDYGIKQKTVRFILILGSIQFLAVMAPNMQWQPFFGQFIAHKTTLGFLWAGMAGCLIAGSALAPWFLRKVVSEQKALVISQVIIGVGLLAAVATKIFPIALSAFLVHEIARGLFRPLKDVYLNDNIPSAERATLISFESISHHIGGMFGLVISGALAKYAGIPAAWIFAGMILIVGTLLLAKNGHRA